MFSRKKTLQKALIVAAFGAFSSMASADYIGTFAGNDCSGVYGTFPNCVVNDTPIIIKFDFNDSGAITETSINPQFLAVDGTEFSFNFGTNTWTYTPGTGDPVITHFVAKGGNAFNLFSNTGDANSDIWSTPLNPNNGQPFGLSHLSFYDFGGDQGPEPKVPEPASMLLLGAGLLALGLVRRRKRD